MSLILLPDDVEAVLDELGMGVGKVTDDEVWALCPAHSERVGKKDTSPTNFSVNSENGLVYCLAAETEVMVRDRGRVPIKNLAGTTATILTEGGWVDAPFRSYGVQELRTVTLSRNGVTKTVRSTPEHRWFVRVSQRGGGRRVVERTTEAIRPGHRLAFVKPPRGLQGEYALSAHGAAHGVVFGDGTAPKQGSPAYVDLWGAKNAPLQELFPHRELRPVQQDHLTGVRATGLPRQWKNLPPLSESPAYLMGFLAGYFAADGCVSKKGDCILSSADKDVLEWVIDLAPRLGLVTLGLSTQVRVGLGDGPSELHHLRFLPSSMFPEFFLLDEHRRRFEGRDVAYERLGWSVVSVEDHGEVEEVFCAEVEEYHHFALADNILTGNCFSCGYKDSLTNMVAKYFFSNDAWAAAGWLRERGASLVDAISRMDKRVKESHVEAGLVDGVDPDFKFALFGEPPPLALDQRNLTAEACARYQVRWDEQDSTWIVPFIEPDGRVYGWQRKGKNKFLNEPEHMRKRNFVFGLHHLPSTRGILVESPLDVVRLASAGYGGGLSTYGVEISDKQVQMIVQAVDSLVLALDNDRAGRKVTRELTERLGRRMPTRLFNYGRSRAKDPGDMTDEEIDHGMDNAWSTLLMPRSR